MFRLFPRDEKFFVMLEQAAALMASVLNTVGAFTTTKVAATIGKGIVDPSVMTQALLTGASEKLSAIR